MDPRFRDIRFDNSNVIVEAGGNRVIASGHYFFSGDKLADETIKVEYTLAYVMEGGRLKMDVHHSSLPFRSEHHCPSSGPVPPPTILSDGR